MATCVNDHAAPDEAAFCPTCGAPVASAQPTRPVLPPQVVDRPRADPAGGRERRHGLIAAGGAAILTIALAVSLVVSRTHDGSPHTKQAASASERSEAPDPGVICSNQLYAMIQDIADNSDEGFRNETLVNGVNDPFLAVLPDLISKYYVDREQLGISRANDALVVSSVKTCAEQLHDQIRPNYPTDGTYPGQQ